MRRAQVLQYLTWRVGSHPENGWRAPAPVWEGLPSRCSGADSMRMRPGGLAVENGDGAKGDCCGPRYTMLCNQDIY